MSSGGASKGGKAGSKGSASKGGKGSASKGGKGSASKGGKAGKTPKAGKAGKTPKAGKQGKSSADAEAKQQKNSSVSSSTFCLSIIYLIFIGFVLTKGGEIIEKNPQLLTMMKK